MTSLIIYDSAFGNTQKVAETISNTLKGQLVRVSDFRLEMLKKADLLVVGGPIQGWRPIQSIADFLKNLPAGSLQGKDIAAFDTRIKIFFSGSASDKIHVALEDLGGNPIIAPTNFIVKGKEGPLLEGELDKAKTWSQKILTKIKNKTDTSGD